MRQPQQNMTNINPKYFWIHRLVSAPGGTLLLVPIMTFFPRKIRKGKTEQYSTGKTGSESYPDSVRHRRLNEL